MQTLITTLIAIVAGIYGGIAVARKIVYVQALPAPIPLVLLHIPQ